MLCEISSDKKELIGKTLYEPPLNWANDISIGLHIVYRLKQREKWTENITEWTGRAYTVSQRYMERNWSHAQLLSDIMITLDHGTDDYNDDDDNGGGGDLT